MVEYPQVIRKKRNIKNSFTGITAITETVPTITKLMRVLHSHVTPF